MAPAVPEVVVDLAVLVRPEVVAGLARLPLPSQLAVRSQLALLALREVVVDLARLPVLLPLEVAAELAVEELPLHRSFSAATAGILPSTGTPRYSPVPRSGRRAKHRP